MSAVITLVIAILILALIYWALGLLPVPQPFLKIIQVILVVVAVILLINFALSFTDYGPFIRFR